MISVICVTNRQGALDFYRQQLDKQTFRDFETIIADDLYDQRPICCVPKVTHFKPRQKEEGDAWNINKAYNDALEKAQGELLVFLQDFIHIQANGLERFWEVYQLYPDCLITGVGHKAKHGLEGISEVDERALQAPGLYPGNHSHFELNWAACPRKIAVPFSEEMDKHYGGENQYFAYKANKPVWIDASNRCIGLSQEECGGRPADWEEKHFNKQPISWM